MGRLRSRMKAKRAKRQERRSKRVASRDRRKDARVAKRERRSIARTDRRERRGMARDVRKTARLSKRQAKKLSKIYGDMSPEEIEEINSVQPYTGEMASQLQEDGVMLEDPTDTVEVASKYVQLSPEMDDPIDEDVYNDAFVNVEEDFDSHFDFAKAKQNAKRALMGALAGVGNEFQKYVGEVEDKSRSGEALTKNEERLLKVKGKAEDVVMDNIMDTLKGWLPWILAAFILYLLIRKKL